MYIYLGVTIIFIAAFSPLVIAAPPTAEQKEEWEKLYPKLNSKMARMEELLNFIDRFLGDEEFKNEVLNKISELIYHTNSSKNSLPSYLLEEENRPFTKALTQTAETCKKLYKAIQLNDEKKAKELFLKLDKLRRNSHSKWAE